MINPARWWHNKIERKRNNWLLAALGCCFLAAFSVESTGAWALLGGVPAFVFVVLEAME